MAMSDLQIPVYLITGFLESGKTTFLNNTIHESYFEIPGTTLLLLTEEGEEEFNVGELKKKQRTEVWILKNKEDLNPAKLEYLDRKLKPDRVIIEYNPLWSVDELIGMKLPRHWVLAQHIVLADASTFQIYMNNMKSIFVEMIRQAEMVIFNRSREDMPLANFRRSVKVVNPGAEIVFEKEDHSVIDLFEDSLPYDIKQEEITIAPEDYGIWYVDLMDNLEDYEGKKVRFQGRVLKSRDEEAKFFVPGRMAMTCCADDTTFLGYVCKSDQAPSLEEGSWVEVYAEIRKEYLDLYHKEGPVLYAKEVKACQPLPEEMVYFN